MAKAIQTKQTTNKINVREIRRIARIEAKNNKRAGDMSDLEHLLFPLWRHRATVFTFSSGALLMGVLWLVLSYR